MRRRTRERGYPSNGFVPASTSSQARLLAAGIRDGTAGEHEPDCGAPTHHPLGGTMRIWRTTGTTLSQWVLDGVIGKWLPGLVVGSGDLAIKGMGCH